MNAASPRPASRSFLRALSLVALLPAVSLISACKGDGCLSGDEREECRVPSPCTQLAFSCEPDKAGSVEARVIQASETVPGGLDAQGAVGDILLGNDRLVAVIEKLDAPHFLGPSGGNILDLGTRGGDDDGVNQIVEVVGILPADAVRWKTVEIVSSGPDVAAVQVRGELDGRPFVKVATRYEVRPCEPGIRVRTEVVNLGRDYELWALGDGYYWSGREALPFTPGANEGFRHDSFDLLTINGVYKSAPFLAWSSHAPPYASYSSVACSVPSMEGFNSSQVSAAGLKREIIAPRDYQVFERFISVTNRKDVAGGADLALEVRRQLFGERYVTLKGRILSRGVPVDGSEVQGAVVVSELPSADAPIEQRIPWTQAVPDANGVFTARVPAGKRYLLETHAYGRVVASQQLEVAQEDVDLGDLQTPLTSKVELVVTDSKGTPIDARVVFTAADALTEKNTSGTLFGGFQKCTPFLGPQNGPSPACNQVLVRANDGSPARGPTFVDVPAGSFHVYATAGMFWSLGHKQVTLDTSAKKLSFVLDPLPLLPADTVSADLHVHGRRSFDSSIPDEDRALAFSAANVDVIAATDHDVVGDYSVAVKKLGLGSKVAVMNGLETTGHIPWFKDPGETIPRVVGHYNFWPMQFDDAKPRKGGPDDERIEPGELFSRVAPLFSGTGVIELNHPWADPEFGRDLGYPRAIKMNLKKPLPKTDDGSNNGMFIRTPAGASFANNGHHAQEVMNGSQNDTHLQYRAVWFAFLNQGLVYTGTANSDSHGLTDNVLGTPRNVVFAKTSAAKFDPEIFNAAIREGRVLGTNGPIIEATLTSGSEQFTPSLKPLAPKGDASLHVVVRAAPWVPVRQVRVVVNGETAKTFDNLPLPAEAFGKDVAPRLDVTVPLAEVLPADGKDAWIVLEAGEPLQMTGDLDDNGVPDTGDNNGDGVVDKNDLGKDQTTGPLLTPEPPADDTDPRYHFAAVTAGGLPQSFTNPFLLDRDGNGFQGPGLKGDK